MRKKTAGTRRVLLSLALAGFLTGCATLPHLDPPEQLPSAERPVEVATDSPALSVFLLDVQRDRAFDPSGYPGFFVLLDLEDDAGVAGTAGRELTRRGILERRVLDRARHALILEEGSDRTYIWLSGRYPRFWTARALRLNGWSRERPGVWSSGGGAEITLYSGGLLRVDLVRTEGDSEPVRMSPPDRETTAVELLRRVPTDPAVLVFLAEPAARIMPIEVDPRRVPLESLFVHVDSRNALDLSVVLSNEQSARVMLVTMRLGSRRLLESFSLIPGDAFALAREDRLVRLSGVFVTEETVRDILGRVFPEEESSREENSR